MAEIINFDDYLNKLVDDTIENVVMEKSIEVGRDVSLDLMEIEPEGTENTGILFSIWSTLTTTLMIRGWEANELRKSVTYHKKEADEIKKEWEN